MQKVIYLDHNATTPVDQKVLEVMLPYFNTLYGNPSGNSHPQSWMTAGAVKNARSQVAELINADPSEIIFTSGATESINLAIKGVLKKSTNSILISSNIEHAAGLEVSNWARSEGIDVQTLNVASNGLVDLNILAKKLETHLEDKKINFSEFKKNNLSQEPIILVSLILAHNEIGSLYSIEKISELKSKYNFVLHLDATQALLTETIDVHKNKIDLLSFSAHKLYGPKGIGGLFINKKTIGHQIQPLIDGGGQEFGLRSGTLNVPGIVGFGEACKITLAQRNTDKLHFRKLSEYFETLLKEHDINAKLNGDQSSRIFQNMSITLPEKYKSTDLLTLLNGFCISQGSACGSGKTTPNQTLASIGLNESEIQLTLRIGLGRSTTENDLKLFVQRLANTV